MNIIEIKSLENGGHNNKAYTGILGNVPEGWAVIQGDEELLNFPFGSFDTEYIDGVPFMVEGSWVPSEMPKPEPLPEPEVEPDVWDELAEAYRQGVQSAYDE